MTYVGTLRSNKPHVPEMMKANCRREHSSLFGYHDQLTITSYVPKQGKAILVLSTLYHDSSVSGPDKKPDDILHYNKTKSEVDHMDHLATVHTSRRKINRWPMCLFFNMLDVGGIAAFIVWLGNDPDWKLSEGTWRRHIFLTDLGYAMVTPHVKERATIATLQAPIR